MKSRQSQGFTLIELIIVIVILGILAVTAGPKLIGISSDARISILQGIQGAMKSSMSMTLSYGHVQGVTNALNQDLTLPSGEVVRLDYGYPEHSWETAWRQMLEGDFELKSSGGICDGDADLCVDSDFNIGGDVSVAGSSSAMVIWPNGVSTADNCYVYYAYSAASRGNEPVIGAILDGC